MTTRRASSGCCSATAGTDSRREERGGAGGATSAPPASGADPSQRTDPDADLAHEREDHALDSRGASGGHDADPAKPRTLRCAATGDLARDGCRGTCDEPAAGDGGPAAKTQRHAQNSANLGAPSVGHTPQCPYPSFAGVCQNIPAGFYDWHHERPSQGRALRRPRGQHRTSSLRAPDCADMPAAAPGHYGTAACRRGASRRLARVALLPTRAPGASTTVRLRPGRVLDASGELVSLLDDGCSKDEEEDSAALFAGWVSERKRRRTAQSALQPRRQSTASISRAEPDQLMASGGPRSHPVGRGFAASGGTGSIRYSARRCWLALRQLMDGHAARGWHSLGYRSQDLQDSDGSLWSGTLIGSDGP